MFGPVGCPRGTEADEAAAEGGAAYGLGREAAASSEGGVASNGTCHAGGDGGIGSGVVFSVPGSCFPPGPGPAPAEGTTAEPLTEPGGPKKAGLLASASSSEGSCPLRPLASCSPSHHRSCVGAGSKSPSGQVHSRTPPEKARRRGVCPANSPRQHGSFVTQWHVWTEGSTNSPRTTLVGAHKHSRKHACVQLATMCALRSVHAWPSPSLVLRQRWLLARPHLIWSEPRFAVNRCAS